MRNPINKYYINLHVKSDEYSIYKIVWDKNIQAIDSARFYISASDIFYRNRADNQREKNDSKSREIFGCAALASDSIFPPLLYLLDYLYEDSRDTINLCGQR